MNRIEKTKKFMAGKLPDVALYVAREISERWPDGATGKYATLVETTRGGLVVKVFIKSKGQGES